jgi:hypothetical protein
MRSVSKVFPILFTVCLLTATVLAPAAGAATKSGSRSVPKGIIARILDYVLPDISLPPGLRPGGVGETLTHPTSQSKNSSARG